MKEKGAGMIREQGKSVKKIPVRQISGIPWPGEAGGCRQFREVGASLRRAQATSRWGSGESGVRGVFRSARCDTRSVRLVRCDRVDFASGGGFAKTSRKPAGRADDSRARTVREAETQMSRTASATPVMRG